MKIGILTLFHGNRNWGGILQGYALKLLLEKRYANVDVDILIYRSDYNLVYPSLRQQIQQFSFMEIIEKVKSKICHNKIPAGVSARLVNRFMLLDTFTKKYETNSKVYTDDNLTEAAEEYDCLISGSDQIWNPNVARPGFLQSMIEDNCKKISYAASIARNDLSKYEQSVLLPLIQRFDAISVRENTAKEILDRYMMGIKTTEVLDPVMMFDANEWRKLYENQNQNNERYALAFFFSDSFRYRQEIKQYCLNNCITLKFIPFAKQEYLASDEKGFGERIYDVGPEQFINLFDNAECIFTDSFHGSVFSIIFKKNFCVFERDKNTKVSKNSRLYDLLDKFKLSDRLIRNIVEINCIMSDPIDYYSVEILLTKYRQSSLRFLDEALNIYCDDHDE